MEFRSSYGLYNPNNNNNNKSEMEIFDIAPNNIEANYYSDGDRVFLITFPPKPKSCRRLQKEKEKEEKRKKKAERDCQRTIKREFERILFLKTESLLLHSIQSLSQSNNNNNLLIEEKKKLEKTREREIKASKHYEDKQKKTKTQIGQKENRKR